MSSSERVAESSRATIACIGGTGPQGKGLAYRFAAAGHRVLIGSRSPERASHIARGIADRTGNAFIGGTSNDRAARLADIAVLAVPFNGHAELVTTLADALEGKIVISCVNPLGFDKLGPFGLAVKDGSAAEEAQRLMPQARVVAAFHHLSAVSLWGDEDKLAHEDVLVCGDDEVAKDVVCGLSHHITGRRGIDAGRLRLAGQLESLTSVLISVNKRHSTTAGIRIAGLAHA